MCFKRKKPDCYWQKRKKTEWDYNSFLKPICGLLTNHRHKRLIAWSAPFSENGYRYANRYDFYYKCKICGWVYFNHSLSKEDLQYIKKFDAEKRLEELNKEHDN